MLEQSYDLAAIVGRRSPRSKHNGVDSHSGETSEQTLC